MSIQLNPKSLIGTSVKSFDPDTWWVIIDYDEKTGLLTWEEQKKYLGLHENPLQNHYKPNRTQVQFLDDYIDNGFGSLHEEIERIICSI